MVSFNEPKFMILIKLNLSIFSLMFLCHFDKMLALPKDIMIFYIPKISSDLPFSFRSTT